MENCRDPGSNHLQIFGLTLSQLSYRGLKKCKAAQRGLVNFIHLTNFEPDFINFWESQNLKIVWGLRPSTPHTKHWNSE